MSTGGEFISDQEALKDGLTPVEVYLKHIERAQDDQKDWVKTAEQAICIYEAGDGEKGKGKVAFNILHSNIETIVPALYNSTPIPDIRRRYNDQDPVAKQGVDILERCISYQIDQYDFDGVMTQTVKDSELAGRGVARLRYKPEINQQQSEAGEAYDAVGYQALTCEHVVWNKWGHGPGRCWDDVQIVYFEHDMTSADMQDMGVEQARIDRLSFDDTTANERKEDKASGPLKTVRVYEVWDKRRRLVVFLSPQDKQAPIKVIPDPLGLPGFFPVPEMLLPVRKRANLTPITPYEIYSQLVEELETITKRITALIKQLKVRGLIDANLADDFERLKLNEDGQYEPANDASMFASGGGLEKAIAHWPLEPTVIAVRELYVQREQIKQTIYEVSGVSDILRGATDPNETLGAQQIKAQWGNQRLQRKQAEVARFARDLFRMMAAVICKKFTSENIQAMAQLQMQPQVEQVLRSDAMRSYRIDIESDSTIRADMSRSQEQMNIFLQGTGQYVQAVLPMVQGMPQSMPTWVEIYISFARRFKLGKQAEDALESLSQQAQAIAKQPQEEQPDPEVEKAKAQMQVMQQKAQLDAQTAQTKAQADMQSKQMDMQHQERKAQLEEQKMMLELQIKREELALKREEMGMRREELSMQQSAKVHDLEIQKRSSEIDLEAKEKAAAAADKDEAA